MSAKPRPFVALLLVLIACAAGHGVSAQDSIQKGFVERSPDERPIAQRAERKKDVPDIDMFLKLTLPVNPSKAEAIDYINTIAVLSSNQRSVLRGDPQVTMLSKVGRDHLDVLLASSESGPMATYGPRAIAMLATDEDKAWTLELLPGNRQLAYVVLAKGWCVDAMLVFVQMLSSKGSYLPDELFGCLAYVPQQEYLPALKAYIARSGPTTNVLRQVQGISGIDISADLPRAWDLAYRNRDRYELGYWTYETLAVGYLPAFHSLFEVLDDNMKLPVTIYDAESLIHQFSNLYCSKDELAAWYRAHRNHIRFDSRSRRFTAVTQKDKSADRCPADQTTG